MLTMPNTRPPGNIIKTLALCVTNILLQFFDLIPQKQNTIRVIPPPKIHLLNSFQVIKLWYILCKYFFQFLVQLKKNIGNKYDSNRYKSLAYSLLCLTKMIISITLFLFNQQIVIVNYQTWAVDSTVWNITGFFMYSAYICLMILVCIDFFKLWWRKAWHWSGEKMIYGLFMWQKILHNQITW